MFNYNKRDIIRSSVNLDIGPLTTIGGEFLVSGSVEQGIVIVDCTLGRILTFRDDIRPIVLVGDGGNNLYALLCDQSTIINIELTSDG